MSDFRRGFVVGRGEDNHPAARDIHLGDHRPREGKQQGFADIWGNFQNISGAVIGGRDDHPKQDALRRFGAQADQVAAIEFIRLGGGEFFARMR